MNRGPRSYRNVAVLPGKLVLAFIAASPTASVSIYSTRHLQDIFSPYAILQA